MAKPCLEGPRIVAGVRQGEPRETFHVSILHCPIYSQWRTLGLVRDY